MRRIQQLVALLMVLISLGLGWYAWVLGKRSLTEKSAESSVPRLSVVVAAKPISAGVPIPRDAIKIDSMTVRPEGAFENLAAVEGKIPAVNIVIGEPILAQRMYGLEKGMVTSVLPGERAVAVKVDEVIGVGNRLNPHDVVDVFAIMRRNNDEIAETQSQLLLAGITVLAVGNRSVQGRNEKPVETESSMGSKYTSELPRTAVLAVPLKDVSRLALAAETGKILLALRSPLEQTPPLAKQAATAVRTETSERVTLRQVTSGYARGGKSESGVEIIRGL